MGRLMAFVALAGALLGLTSRASAAPEPTVTVATQNLPQRATISEVARRNSANSGAVRATIIP